MDLHRYVETLGRGEWKPSTALVYGEEELGVEEASLAIARAVLETGAVQTTRTGSEFDLDRFTEELSQRSLFAERRLFLLEGITSSADVMLQLLEKADEDPDLFLLVRHKGGVDKRLRWYKRAASKGAIFRFDAVKEREMPERIRERARLLGLEMSIEAAQALASRVGTDLITARNELEKLSLFAAGKKKIDLSDVEEVVGRSRDTIFYEITEGIARRDRARALADLKDLLRQGVAAGAILSLLGREIRFLLQAKWILEERPAIRRSLGSYFAFSGRFRDTFPEEVKETFGAGRGNLLRQHPYVVFLRLRQASRFGGEELLDLLSAFSGADRAIKTGAGSPETVLFATVGGASAPQGGGGR